MAVQQIEKTFEMEDIAPEGTVISKDRVTRYFQGLKEYANYIVVSCSEFKLHWDSKTISCRFGVKSKYVEDTVPKQQFLDLMTTNENLMRDLETANERIQEYVDGAFEACDNEQLKVCAAKFAEIVEQEKKDNPLVEVSGRGDRANEAVIAQDIDCNPDNKPEIKTDGE